MSVSAKDRLIVALDVPSRPEAMALVTELAGTVGMFKIGSQLFVAEGPDLVRDVIRSGNRVFLDLKFHDIPNTVMHAAREAARLGVSMLTVHASGGAGMIRDTVGLLDRELGAARPKVVAVTVLTSMSAATLMETGVSRSTPDQARHLALMACQGGADGIVCSPLELEMLRGLLADRTIVTPGIRLPGDSANDQERIATPVAAVQAGADYLVVGRSITSSTDPRKTAMGIVESLISTASV